jgi:hypothetical protein
MFGDIQCHQTRGSQSWTGALNLANNAASIGTVVGGATDASAGDAPILPEIAAIATTPAPPCMNLRLVTDT